MNFNTEPEQDEAKSQDDLNAAFDQGDSAFVTESPKKMVSKGTLGLVGLLAICAAGTYFMYIRGGPQTANAADVTTAETINTFLADGERHVKLMKEMLKETDKVVLRFRQTTAQSQIPLDRLQTNPFRMEAPKSSADSETEDASSSRRRRQEERAAAVAAVQSLKLQSVLYGTQRAALLNNRMVQEGSEVEGFIVDKITSDSVVVRLGVYRFELKMQK